ncbi:transposase [Pseudorhodobacter aquimaris]|uniref:transposase n=1 Tax=Pseudorhodobacter aquimaris TaxID=687412 RepID=UPI000A4A7C62|nr:transposase [Pseudorhodobacter aquimaris]
MKHRDDWQSEAAALTAVACRFGCAPDSLRTWVRQIQFDGGVRPGPASQKKARIKELERENRELRQANEVLRKALAYSERRAIVRDPKRESSRARSDSALSVKIDAAWEANRKLYRARKIWHVLRWEGQDVAPCHGLHGKPLPGNGCTVERLMRNLGIRGGSGKEVKTTNPDRSVPCPDDKVNRLFRADRPD